jgi:phosphoglycolate phosphatase-like HAD superfamily hydrolase
MDLESLEEWTKTTNELSNNSVIREIEKKPDSIILKKALSWSNKVNASIKALPEEEILPFEMVKEALEFAHVRADVAIVSSANLGAVLDEWTRHNLIAHTDIVLAQNAGTKAYCIQELLKKGYDPNNVLMCGDALGDLEAANKNNVHFYPILVRNEKQSWTEFITIGFEKLLSNEYSGEYQEKKIQEFLSNLGGK